MSNLIMGGTHDDKFIQIRAQYSSVSINMSYSPSFAPMKILPDISQATELNKVLFRKFRTTSYFSVRLSDAKYIPMFLIIVQYFRKWQVKDNKLQTINTRKGNGFRKQPNSKYSLGESQFEKFNTTCYLLHPKRVKKLQSSQLNHNCKRFCSLGKSQWHYLSFINLHKNELCKWIKYQKTKL